MSLPRIAIHRPITTLVFLTSILVLGFIATSRMKLAYFPNIDFPGIFIQIPYPNSSPSQIEKNIVKPVEETLATMSGIKKMTSRATPDAAEINLEFDWGTKLDIIRTEIGEKLEVVRKDLPPDVEHINIFNFNASDIPVVQARISAPGMDLGSNYDLIEKRIKVPIQRIPGVARVQLEGVNPKAIYVNLILDKIREHNVDVGQLIERLQKNNSNASIGKIRNDQYVVTVRSLGSFLNFEELSNLPINDNGLRLKDIAEIEYTEPAIDFGRHLNHSYAVAVEVYKEPTANTVEVATKVTDMIKNDFPNDPYLKGVELFVIEDQAKEIKGGLEGITDSGIWGAIFAIIILYLFLRRIDMTLVVSLAIPISILCGSMVLYYLGHTFNVMSMMGLMLSVGMLVDDAIVVLESIYKCRQEGLSRLQSAERGSRLVTMAVTASTVTTIIVFLPLIVGKKTNITTFLAEIGVSLTVTLLCSLLVSLTLIPLVTSRFLHDHRVEDARWIRWMKEKYNMILRWTFVHRWKTALAVVLLLASIALPFKLGLQTGQFAGSNNKRQFIHFDFSDFTYKADVERIVTQVENFLETQRKEWPAESIYSRFGDSDAFVIYTFTSDNTSEEQAKKFRSDMRQKMPKFGGVKIYFEDEDQSSGGNAKFFSLYLYGEDLETLKRIARESEVRLAKVKGIEDLRLNADTGRREVQMVLNRERAIQLGITPRDLSQIALFCLGGQHLHRYTTPEKEIDMILGLRVEDRENIEDLKNLTIGAPGGGQVPLASIVDFNIVEGQNVIERQNRKNYLSIRATYEGKDWDGARKEIAAVMDSTHFPTGDSWSFDERIQSDQEDNRLMIINFLLALALVYIVMASLFESLIHPLAIIISIPFALVGVVWVMLLTGSPFNILAQIGLLILIGVVVRNGIVLVDRVHQLRNEGMSRNEALLKGGDDRLRPILMTAGTTVLGLLPLAVGHAALLSLNYAPLARAVMGGLTASTFLTLIILPFVYTLFDDAAAWARRVWFISEHRRPVAVESPAAGD